MSVIPIDQKPGAVKHGRKRSLASRLWLQKDLQSMALPGVIWMIIFNFIPMYFIIIAFQNFKPVKGITHSEWLWFQNFAEFFTSDRLWLVIRNTIGLNFLRLVIGFPIPIIFAVLLNELVSLRYKKVVQTVTYLPHFLSWIIVGGIMYNWLSSSGFLTELLVKIGVLKQPEYLIAMPKYFWGILITSEVWKEFGWNSIIYIAAISAVDPNLFEAATIDGAGRLKKIWHVLLPGIKGTIAVLLVLNIGNLLGSNFDQLYVFYKPVLYDVVDVIDMYSYRVGILSNRLSFATAIGLCRSIVAFALLFAANKASGKLTGTALV